MLSSLLFELLFNRARHRFVAKLIINERRDVFKCGKNSISTTKCSRISRLIDIRTEGGRGAAMVLKLSSSKEF